MAFTKVVGPGIHTLSNIASHNINSSGIITATKFVGPFDNINVGGATTLTVDGINISAGILTAQTLDLNGNGDISGNLVVGGNLTANGDLTTLNTTLREVELLRVDANSSVAAGIITQKGSGDILKLYDNTTEVFSVEDGGKVKIGMGALGTNTSDYDAAANNLIVGTGSGDEGITILSGQSVGHHGSIFFADGTGATNSKRGQIRYEQNSERMKFFTAGTQKLTIDINGKVGIGSEIPAVLLDVQGHAGSGAQTTIRSKSTAANASNFVRSESSDGLYIGLLKYGTSHADYGALEAGGGAVYANSSVPITIMSDGGSGYINFATGGNTERVRIKSDGSVGIGSTDPRANFKLDVNGDLSLGESGGTDNTYIEQKQNGDLHLINSGRDSSGAAVNPTGGAGGIGINRYNTIGGDTTYFRDFTVYNGKSTKVLMVDGSESRVGIGTDAPDGKLDVRGTIFVNGDGTGGRIFASGGNLSLTDGNGRQTLRIEDPGSGNTHTHVFNSDGRLGIGTDAPATQLHLYGASNIIRLTDTDTSGPIHTNIDGASGYLTLDVGSIHRDVVITSVAQANEIARFTGDGLVGIGTATPPDWCRFSIDHGQNGLTRFSNHSHLLLQNKNAGTTDFWSLAPRDNGSITLARGTTDSNGTVASAGNSRFGISSAGRVGVGSDPTAVSSFFEANYTSGTVAYPFETENNSIQSYSPYDHEVTIKNNTVGTEDNFCGIFFKPGAHSDGNRISCARISAIDVGDYRADLVFGTRGYRGGNIRFQEVLRLDHDGHASLKTGNLAFANGAGIDFSNVPDGSRSIDTDGNKLDDYEEGSFTPAYSTQSAAMTASYVNQDGKYTKIGRFVHFQIYLRLSSKSGGSGHLRVYGLPFTSSSATGAAYGGGVVAYTNNWDNDAIDRIMVGSGSDQVQLFVGTSSGTNVNAGAGNLNSDTQLRIFGSYQV